MHHRKGGDAMITQRMIAKIDEQIAVEEGRDDPPIGQRGYILDGFTIAELNTIRAFVDSFWSSEFNEDD
jgi:hypothetical protein